MTEEKVSRMLKDSLQRGEIRMAKQLKDSCKEGAVNLDEVDKKGNTLLHTACNNGKLDTVKFLIREGASLNVQDSEGRTPVHVSCTKSYVEITRYLLDHGADVMVYDKEGELPLDVAANLDIALILVDKMVSLGFKDLVNDYILPLNLSKTSNAKTEPLTSSTLIESLQKGEKHSTAEIDSPKGAGAHQVGCRFRLSNVAEDTDQNQQGNESTDDDEDNVVLTQTRRYTFPSYLGGFNKPAGSILKRSQSYDLNNTSFDLSPIFEAKTDKTRKVARKISLDMNRRQESISERKMSSSRSVTFPSDILCQVCIMDNDYKDLNRLILSDKIRDLNKVYANGISALHLAAIENRPKCAEVLLDCGADVEITDPHGWTPLHAAAFAGNIKCVKVLCNKGADICATTSNGETVFDIAATDLIRKYLKMMTIRLVMEEKKHDAIKRINSL